MSKIISLSLVSVLTIAAAGFWLKSSVSETSARSRIDPGQGLSVYDLHLAADVKSLPDQKMDDKTFVFTEAD